MGDVTVQLLMMVVEPLQCDPRVDDHQPVVDEIWTVQDFQPDWGSGNAQSGKTNF